MTEPTVTVDGNAAGGWHVSVHDGNTFANYSPEAATAEEAKEKALAMHASAVASAVDPGVVADTKAQITSLWAHIEALFSHTGAPKP